MIRVTCVYVDLQLKWFPSQ
ncbi:Protein CBG27035 [Caenorhabditis briggsae]|uniref:Protein CBG27035 n=1 Tax=Caenorhabditis briggsae TaxID=6238 RepID=B6IM99_CAEBR|nr:Protein CBG27035 [Caenorhabditis briggsae]CAS01029.1 Protein CBG27035 [Caenorhabditis briggsae]